MTNRRRLAAALSATAFTAIIAAPAEAQQVDRIVSFGDSYADTGNAIAIILANPATPQATKDLLNTAYPTGRFSGGTNYIDSLADILDVPIVDFAVGGATTGATNNGFPGLPGLTQEVGVFLSNTTPPGTFFPIANGFQEGDLLALSIGGNDARAYYTANPGATTTQAAAAAATSVTQASANLDLLVNAGAPTISFLAIDASGAPDLLGSPSNQALAHAFSTAFNTGFQTTLAGYAADGVIVHYLDGSAVLANVLADPAAFGINNIYCPPLAPATPTCLINAGGYLFYGDGVHLTSDGFKIIAQYVAAQLTAPLTLQAPSDLGMDVAREFGRTLTARMDLGAPRDGDLPEGLKFFIMGDGFQRSVGEGRANKSFDINMIGGTIGAEYGFGSGVVGFAANYTRPEAEFASNAAHVDGHSTQLGAYAGLGIAGAFVQGYLGYGWDRFDVARQGVLEGMDADSDGHHWLIGAKAGYLVPMAGMRLGPVAALDYAKVSLDGYTESGDDALTLNVSDTDISSLRGSVGIEARGDFGGEGSQFRPYGSLVLEKELTNGDRSVSFSQTSAPTIVNSFAFDDVSKKAYGRATVGLSARILANATMAAGISATFGKKQGNETSGHLGVKLAF